MEIKDGKYYKTRDGRKVGPMKYNRGDNEPFVWTSAEGGTWSHSGEDGLAPGPMGSPTKGDLIAEWTEEQIGTLKELGVKPGDVVQLVSGIECEGFFDDLLTISEVGTAKGKCGTFMPRFDAEHDRKYRIVSRATPSIDLTAIREPFGLLDKATQDALVAHGGPYQRFWHDGWKDFQPDVKPAWSPVGVYRTTPPGPKRETVKKGAWLDRVTGEVTVCDECNCTITYDTIDGEIDMATYKVTKK